MNPETVVFHMHDHIGTVARMLEWTPENESYRVPMERVERYMGKPVTEITDAQQVGLLFAVAEMEVWRHVMATTASFYSLSTADGERRERRQVHENAEKMFRLTSAKVDQLAGTYAVTVRPLDMGNDPYTRPSRRRENQAWWNR